MACLVCDESTEIDFHGLPHPCNVPQGETCFACMEAQRLEAMISAAKAQIVEAHRGLADLQSRYREIRTQMNRSHNALILMLPPEISSYIFQLAVPRDGGTSQSTLFKKVGPPLALAAVCREWRQLAFSNPQLWMTMSVCLDSPKLLNYADCIRRWLERSGGLPLTIHVYESDHYYLDTATDPSVLTPAVKSVVKEINKHSSRWQHLDVRFPARLLSMFTGTDPSPLLKSLRVEATDARIFDAKFKLKHKATPSHVILSRISLKNITIKWAYVTQVELADVYIDDCFEFLKLAQNLKYCILSEVSAEEESTPSTPSPVIVHSVLRDLKFDNFDDPESAEANQLFGRLSCPALQRLNINMNDDPLPIQALSAFIKRSSCSLKELRIRDSSFDDGELIGFLKEVPTLVKLDVLPHVDSQHEPSTLLQHLADTALPVGSTDSGEESRPSLLPNLQFFRYLADEKKDVPWELLSRVFGPLSEITNPLRRPLHSVHVHLSRRETSRLPSQIEKDVLLDLILLRKAGLDLQVKSDALTRSIDVVSYFQNKYY